MALCYFFNEDEYAGQSQGLDDTGEHFWAGVFRAAAPLALAATVAATALSTQVAAAQASPADEVFASLSPDEDYAPTVLRIPLWHSAWYAGTAAAPAPIAEEDTWQPWLAAPPDVGALYLVAPWAWGSAADDLAVVGTTVAPADEDYWQNGVLPVAATLAWPAPASFEQHDLPPPGQPEEEFWNNAVPSASWSYAPLRPWALDPQDALSVPGTPDEDFWTSGVAPAAYALRALPVWASDPLDEQAAGLVAPPAVVPATFAWVRPFGVAPFGVLVHPVRLFSDVAGLATSAVFTPTQLAGLVAWYKADAIGGLVDGDPVGAWTDSTGQGNALTQNTAAARPTYKVGIQNGLPVLRFDGVDDVLASATPVTTAVQETLVIAFRWVLNTNTPVWWNGIFPNGIYLGAVNGRRDITTSGVINVSSPNVTTTNFEVWDGFYDGTNLQLYVNGAFEVSGASGAMVTPTATQLGGDLTLGFSQVDIGEALVYSRALSAGEHAQLDAYLRQKWGTP